MNQPLLAALVVAVLAVETAAARPAEPVHPYETGTGFTPVNAVDAPVLAELEKRGIQPANPCSDAVFIRRVFIDVLGSLPEPQRVRRFLDDPAADKRAALIDEVLGREEFVDYWTLKWGDLLRVKAEFPINLWPNGVQAYHRWIRDAVRDNRPFDEFARALLTSSGSSFRVAPVNFYRAVQNRTPENLAAAVALTFMGARFEAWPAERRAGMAAFFSRVIYKPTDEWKEEIVIADPAPSGMLQAVFPDGKSVEIPAGKDPRHVFADWLLAPGNPWFARAIANRAWFWFLGRGVVHEPDDIRADNPPANPALLACLERELVAAKYDLKSLFRLILNSRTYQGSSIPRSDHAEAEALFAHYKVRRLDAEVLLDALCRLDGRGQDYVSVVPEPFTILPNVRKSTRLADGTITSSFLETFGRPARDSGLESERNNEPTDAQRLYLLNSSEVQARIQRSPWLRRVLAEVAQLDKNRKAAQRKAAAARAKAKAKGKKGKGRAGAQGKNVAPAAPPPVPVGPIRPIYLAILSRDPTPAEIGAVRSYVERPGVNSRDVALDLIWALINTKEFLYRH